MLLLVICAPKKTQNSKSERENYLQALIDDVLGFDECGKKLSNIECLRYCGWSFKLMNINDIQDTLSRFTIPRIRKMADECVDCIQEDDSIYHFSTPKKAWEMDFGRQGFIIIRKDSVVCNILTILN